MIFSIPHIHYATIASLAALAGIGASIGQGLTSSQALAAIDRQPEAKSEIMRTNLLALALIETASLSGIILAVLLFMQMPTSFYSALAETSVGIVLGFTGLIIGITSSYPAKAAVMAIARQPLLAKKISNNMLLMQSLLQTPLVFAFIVALLARNQALAVTDLTNALRVIASGICMALGTLGPAIGGAAVTYAACSHFGTHGHSLSKISSFTIISQAIIETPIIFAAVIAFWLLQVTAAPGAHAAGYIFIASALCMGIGTFGAGVSSGKTAAAALQALSNRPQDYSSISRTSMTAQGVIDTSALYAFIIAFLLLMSQL